MPKLFSYVVEHDGGGAPNPYFGICTLCLCKYRKKTKSRKNVVEWAAPGDWVIGTGGANLKKSSGHGTLIYAMRVDEKLTRQQYFVDRRFSKKKPGTNGTYEQKQGDNKRPRTPFERNKQSVLISRHFYYFGRNAIRVPKNKFRNLEKTGPWFRSDFDKAYIARFAKWLETETRFRPGKHGVPCKKKIEGASKRKRSETCKSSC